MAFLNKVGEELQEESYHEQSDVHAVHICIRGHYYLIITQALQPVLNIQGRLQQIEFLVFVNHLFRHTVTVQRLAPQREYGLCVHIAALGDAAAGRITLGNEDAGVFLLGALGI